ncbi:MAG: putative integral rane protein [Naasia sp.]|jgi:hypothetical protein|uniref:hypothetical protein n=1 Tax=Naasia sp. TaxID=2546198 RepID=UPI0026118255|nr:hypothetical protein [Naasia sp.]MCU1570089.1 putative integral rane protein [Naasia sp.]
MSDERPIRRTEEPAPTADPAEVGKPTLVESHGDPIVVDGHTADGVLVEPGEPAPEEGPAHRAAAPVDGDAPSEPGRAERPAAETREPIGQGSRPAAVAVPADAPAASPAPASASAESSVTADAPIPPVPTPTEPVAETSTAPVAAPPTPRTVYVESPIPPRKKGNRGFAILMSLLGTIVYALIWAAVAAAVIATGSDQAGFGQSFSNFVTSPVFWIPILLFGLSMILVSLILNRAGWTWWILLGFVVAVVVYFGYLGGALLTVSQQITSADVGSFLNQVAFTPLSIGAAVVAREVSIWTGRAISARGKRLKAHNATARAEFDHETAERKAEYERAQAGYAGS